MDILKDMFHSKKHVVAIVVMLIVAFNKKLGLELTDQDIRYIVATAAALIMGQGVADFGKGKVQAEHKLNGK